MSYLRRMFTPLGVSAMFFALWLPWVRIECRGIEAQPDLWQLADVDAWFYVPALLAVLLALFGIVCVWRRGVRLCLVFATLALMSCVTCVYMLVKRQEMARQQIELQAAGGDLGAWMKDLQVGIGAGFWLYFAGAVVSLAMAVWESARSRARPDTSGEIAQGMTHD